VQSRLDLACDTIATTGLVSSCTARAAYFLAHVTPRCAGRVELVTDWGSGRLSQVFAFDLSGPPGTQPPAECGDGVVDDGEACDDGNRDDFDGCDANCFAEPFNGCEAVIQAYYQQAQIAVIDQDEWLGPRSHMMVHDSAQPMRAVDREMCNAALATATDVCNELAATMPFVASCSPSGALWQDDAGNDACSVRFTIGFHSVDPLSGVYTTSLPGILAFTLRSAASASDRAVEL
jgi:cysteine-rich repeat protein